MLTTAGLRGCLPLLPNGLHLPSKAEESHHCALDLDELLCCQSANARLNVRSSYRGELVDHHVIVVIESRESSVSPADADAVHIAPPAEFVGPETPDLLLPHSFLIFLNFAIGSTDS